MKMPVAQEWQSVSARLPNSEDSTLKRYQFNIIIRVRVRVRVICLCVLLCRCQRIVNVLFFNIFYEFSWILKQSKIREFLRILNWNHELSTYEQRCRGEWWWWWWWWWWWCDVEVRGGLQRRGRVHPAVLRYWPQVVQLRRQHAQQHSTKREIFVDSCHTGCEQDRPSAQETGRRPRYCTALHCTCFVFYLAASLTSSRSHIGAHSEWDECT